MKTNVSLFLFAIFSLMFVACENNSDEIVDNASVLSRSVSSYYISGSDKLYADSPETYMIKSVDGSSLPADLKAVWNYPRELQRLGAGDVTITLKQTTALGTYTITADLNDGTSLSKKITTVNEPKPTGGQLQIDSKEVAEGLYIKPVGISKYYAGPYDDINQYKYVDHRYYYMDVYDLHLKCTIENTSEKKLQIDSSLLFIAYGDNSGNVTSLNKTDENNKSLPQYIDLEKGQSITVIYHLSNDWYLHLLPAGVLVFDFSYSQYHVASPGYGYLLSKN